MHNSCLDPIMNVEVMATGIPAINQSLTLQCTANIVRGISSTVDIIWTSGDTQVRRVNNVTASSNINSTSVYNDLFIIPSLDISDIGNLYQCEVFVNSVIPTKAKEDYIIPIPGTYVFTYIHVYVTVLSLILLGIKVRVYICTYVYNNVHRMNKA